MNWTLIIILSFSLDGQANDGYLRRDGLTRVQCAAMKNQLTPVPSPHLVKTQILCVETSSIREFLTR